LNAPIEGTDNEINDDDSKGKNPAQEPEDKKVSNEATPEGAKKREKPLSAKERYFFFLFLLLLLLF